MTRVLTQHTVEDQAAVAGLTGWARFEPVVGSTNTDLLALAREDAPDWSVLVAGHQDAGRGRLGRSWIEPPGSSLLVSVLVRPSLAPKNAPILGLAAGLSMASALGLACGVDVRCKWPNDLLAGGRKLGGILAEAEVEGDRVRHVVIGAGVNVAQSMADFPVGLRDTATSVSAAGGRPDLAALLGAYLSELRRTLNPQGDGPGLGTDFLRSYRGICDTIGLRVAVTTTGGARVQGLAVDVGVGGELLVETASGRVEVAWGEVLELR